MKVVHVISSGGLYGAEFMLMRAVAAQRKQGIDAAIGDVAAPGRASPLAEAARQRGLPVIPFVMRDGFDPAGASRMFRALRDQAFDVIHSHGYKMNVHIGMLAPSLRWARTVATVHGWTATRGFGKANLYQWLDARALRAFNHVVLVSPAMKSRPQLRSLRRVSIIENGIEFGNFASVRRAPPAPKNAKLLLVGRLSPEKGFDLMLSAAARLKSQGRIGHLTIAGDGALRAELTALAASLGIADLVTFAGFVDDMESLYASHDVLVLSSRTEGLPMTLLEAIAQRLPVVATRVGGMPDVLDDGAGGVLVPSENADALADGIASVVDNPEAACARAEIAWQRARARYGVEAMARQYIDVYSHLLADARAKHETVSG
jgi:glycosyltransferase involved in cell wall biosynthesis